MQRGDDVAHELFPYFVKNKAHIVCDIVMDENSLDVIVAFADWKLEDITQLLADHAEVGALTSQCQLLREQVTEGEHQVQSLDRQRQALSDEIAQLEQRRARHQEPDRWSPMAVSRRIAARAPVHYEIARHIREAYAQFVPPSFDHDRLTAFLEEECDITATQEVGYLGQAAVFRQLRDMGKFRRVTWTSLTSDQNAHRITSSEEVFYVIPSTSPYDIEITTFDEKAIFIKVTSTIHEKSSDKVAHRFGTPQLEFFASSTPDRQSVVAFVFGARDSQPQVEYYFSIGPFAEMSTRS
jgi:hypothetical protein